MALVLPRRFNTQPQVVTGPANANIRTLVNFAHNGRYSRDVAGGFSPTFTIYTSFVNLNTNEGRGLASNNGSGAVLHYPSINAKSLVCVGGIYEAGNFPILSVQNAPGSTYRCGFYRTGGFLAFGANGGQAISNIAPAQFRAYKMVGLIFADRLEFWVDGKLAATGTPAADVNLTTPQLILGRGTYSDPSFFGGGFVCAAAALANIPAVGGDILSCNPWGYLFKAPRKMLWEEPGTEDILSCTPADISITPVTATLSSTGIIACSAADLSITPVIATVQSTDPVACSVADLSITPLQAGLVAAGFESINCTAADLSITPLPASITQSGVDSIACAIADLSIIAPAASLFTAGEESIGCSPADIAITSAAASVAESQSIGCIPADISLSGLPCGISQSGLESISCTAVDMQLETLQAGIPQSGVESIACIAADLGITSLQANLHASGLDSIGCAVADISLLALPAALLEPYQSIGCIPSEINITPLKAAVVSSSATRPVWSGGSIRLAEWTGSITIGH